VSGFFGSCTTSHRKVACSSAEGSFHDPALIIASLPASQKLNESSADAPPMIDTLGM
jgi:hypothetical protein